MPTGPHNPASIPVVISSSALSQSTFQLKVNQLETLFASKVTEPSLPAPGALNEILVSPATIVPAPVTVVSPVNRLLV